MNEDPRRIGAEDRDRLVDAALEEDLGPRFLGGDLTLGALAAGAADARQLQRPVGASIVARAPGCISGAQLVRAVFERLAHHGGRRAAPRIEARVEDGDLVEPGQVCWRLSGAGDLILAGERTALNFLQRLSGVATLTRAFVEAVSASAVRILDTRKTTPGWRQLEKAAVVHGGGGNHRFGLYDQVMLKENHFALMNAADGGQEFPRCVRAVRAAVGETVMVHVEARSEEQALAAARSGADVVLLDNFEPAAAVAAIQHLRAERESFARAVQFEISGGVRLENVRAWAATGVDRISIGALTHSAPALDFSLLLDESDGAGCAGEVAR